MQRFAILLYGVLGYAIFFATFLYLIGFTTGFVVPVHVDAGGASTETWLAVLINVGLVALFGIQHTIMARRGFKRSLAKLIPEASERTTFMMATCGVLCLMFWQWRPLPEVLWSVDGFAAGAILGVGITGWTIVLLSTFLIDHFDLFGLRQSWLAFRGRPYTQKPFVERGFYRYVRHPLMLGFLLAMWASPTMTLGHAVLAGSFSVYIALGLLIEERDLVAEHGAAYREYRRRVPKLFPVRRPSLTQPTADPAV